ncbi:heparan-alpha-glucosaminide N-acetyltransferase domain-containing protein [Sinomicrobium weinanense]|uniref:DUF1624 domain-containing protein n=1 Tax=Sinomicrobium weinanense TaxID=2842200 RepID=A0A926JUV2_9FLAO|nr:heparan-alpha-glucosaminide N-acetyltransferase domain-containing protein [Sinomicrobium weinanense]MBC9797985.1 DUF1624 domain-containing protein [Sinomicrobium weinanense]MBU3125498.1 DUF1624 domain-containing protein [Sinomicrobium weinanense]
MRLRSIDILRALTMFFMIWVNDFWTLKEVPKWLEHAKASEDYLGFSDIIFPLFLFIVGLSIPLAIKNRLGRGDSQWTIARHILIRSFSLLLIGVYMVNYETAYDDGIIIGKYLWCIFMAVAVFLIWTHWKKSPVPKKWHFPLQVLGILVLLFLAIIYKGGASGEHWMRTQWWGILGLIGWAYLVNALVFLYARGNFAIMIAAWLVFNILSVLGQTEMALKPDGVFSYASTILGGTVPGFTTAGIVASLVFDKWSKASIKQAYAILVAIGVICLIYGLGTRPLWGISKLRGTPSWLAVCSAMGFMLFALLHYIADKKKIINWARIIAPAGTATLTCYLLPYIIYPAREFVNFRLPDVLNTGIIGLLGSLVFAYLVVALTGWLEKKGIKLKL